MADDCCAKCNSLGNSVGTCTPITSGASNTRAYTPSSVDTCRPSSGHCSELISRGRSCGSVFEDIRITWCGSSPMAAPPVVLVWVPPASHETMPSSNIACVLWEETICQSYNMLAHGTRRICSWLHIMPTLFHKIPSANQS